ncbi:MAG: PaaI family thioesterase [Gammaproteobacteria bacterium]|nr:MAG: PaaI family thioesterase [Gammaproteobacteria bacterium]
MVGSPANLLNDRENVSIRDTIDRLNKHQPPCLTALNGPTEEINLEDKTALMSYTIPLDFCHSGNVVQGGFVASMLDAAMSHAVFANIENTTAVLTLELKVSYLAASLAGPFTAEGKIIRAGRSIAFLDGKLFNEQGELTATASSTGKIILAKTI